MNRQTLLVIAVAVGVAISFSLVQHMFDASDHRKAQNLARTLGGRHGSLEDVLAEHDPGARTDAAWSSEILSGCRGYVRVRCRLPQTGQVYAFDVDLVRKAIHPGNELGRAALAELAGPSKQ